MNWGNKLLLAFIAFGSGMGYLAYRSMNTDFELVENDYYKQELRYQQVIDGTAQANSLSSPVKIEQKEEVIILQLPEEMKNKSVSGDVWFYCAYDSKKDKKFTLKTDNQATQSFTVNSIAPGNYTVKIKWSAEDKSYYSETGLTIF
jgi:hypothetical protein